RASEHTLLTLFESGRATAPAVLVPDGPRLTYTTLRSQVQQVADMLATAGIERADRVAIVLPQGPLAIVGIVGAAVAATAAPLNPSFTEDEFRFFFDDVSARALIVPAHGAEAARAAWSSMGPVIEATHDSVSGALQLGCNGGQQNGRTAEPPSLDDVALILHS